MPYCREDLDHVCRLHTLLQQPYGHAILLGDSGTSCTALAALAGVLTDAPVHIIAQHCQASEYRRLLLTGIKEVSHYHYPYADGSIDRSIGIYQEFS